MDYDALHLQFRRHGYLIMDDMFEPELLQGIADGGLRLWREGKLLDVSIPSRRGPSRFLTQNGQQLIDHIPECRRLHDRLLEVARATTHLPLDPLDNSAIGISMNVMSAGGRFDLHHDRNLITAVTYITPSEGGDMIAYPRFGSWIPERSGLGGLLGRACYGLSKTAACRALFRHVTVKPCPNRVFMFEGTRTLHGVTRVQSSGPRISLQFAYDLPGRNFSVERTADYYGYHRPSPA